MELDSSVPHPHVEDGWGVLGVSTEYQGTPITFVMQIESSLLEGIVRSSQWLMNFGPYHSLIELDFRSLFLGFLIFIFPFQPFESIEELT